MNHSDMKQIMDGWAERDVEFLVQNERKVAEVWERDDDCYDWDVIQKKLMGWTTRVYNLVETLDEERLQALEQDKLIEGDETDDFKPKQKKARKIEVKSTNSSSFLLILSFLALFNLALASYNFTSEGHQSYQNVNSVPMEINRKQTFMPEVEQDNTFTNNVDKLLYLRQQRSNQGQSIKSQQQIDQTYYQYQREAENQEQLQEAIESLSWQEKIDFVVKSIDQWAYPSCGKHSQALDTVCVEQECSEDASHPLLVCSKCYKEDYPHLQVQPLRWVLQQQIDYIKENPAEELTAKTLSIQNDIQDLKTEITLTLNEVLDKFNQQFIQLNHLLQEKLDSQLDHLYELQDTLLDSLNDMVNVTYNQQNKNLIVPLLRKIISFKNDPQTDLFFTREMQNQPALNSANFKRFFQSQIEEINQTLSSQIDQMGFRFFEFDFQKISYQFSSELKNPDMELISLTHIKGNFLNHKLALLTPSLQDVKQVQRFGFEFDSALTLVGICHISGVIQDEFTLDWNENDDFAGKGVYMVGHYEILSHIDKVPDGRFELLGQSRVFMKYDPFESTLTYTMSGSDIKIVQEIQITDDKLYPCVDIRDDSDVKVIQPENM